MDGLRTQLKKLKIEQRKAYEKAGFKSRFWLELEIKINQLKEIIAQVETRREELVKIKDNEVKIPTNLDVLVLESKIEELTRWLESGKK